MICHSLHKIRSTWSPIWWATALQSEVSHPGEVRIWAAQKTLPTRAAYSDDMMICVRLHVSGGTAGAVSTDGYIGQSVCRMIAWF